MLHMSEIRSNVNTPPEALVRALRRLLRPLVKMLLSFQVTYPFLSELLKSLYVEVADEDFKLEGKKQTDTRVSLLTGVHRKDTKRLRSQENLSSVMPTSISVGAQILAVWLSDKHYLDCLGKPLKLPFKLEAGPSFEGLVIAVCKQDIRARVVLDEWLRLGIAELDEEGYVVLLNEAFIAESGLEEKVFYLGMNISDHIAAASHNLLGETPPFMERCVYYDGLSQASVDELDSLAKEHGMLLLKGLNTRAIELVEKDKHETTATRRMNFGLYFYSEEAQLEESTDLACSGRPE